MYVHGCATDSSLVRLAWSQLASDAEAVRMYRILAYGNDRHTAPHCLSIHRSFSCTPGVSLGLARAPGQRETRGLSEQGDLIT